VPVLFAEGLQGDYLLSQAFEIGEGEAEKNKRKRTVERGQGRETAGGGTMKYLKLYLNPYCTGHDKYSLGWWLHVILRSVHIGGWWPLYRIWFFINLTWPRLEYGQRPRCFKRIYNYLTSRYSKQGSVKC
jgi:hypothetical protein